MILQIIRNGILKPSSMVELAQEKSEIEEDEAYRKHEYIFDFENVNDFFQGKISK